MSEGKTGIQGVGLNFYDRRALQANKKKKVYAVAKLMKLCFNWYEIWIDIMNRTAVMGRKPIGNYEK